MYNIVIPTYKQMLEVLSQTSEIRLNTPEKHEIIASCNNQSAAKNRNWVHSQAKSDIIIMMDDDIAGFYPGWLSTLIKPLNEDTNVRLVSARLMKPNGSFAGMMTSKCKTDSRLELVPRIPTACFAYRKSDLDALIAFHNDTSLPFDEEFKGSGWEDNALCHDLYMRFPNAKIMINNECKLIHLNEEKEQKKYLSENKAYFFKTRTEL